MKTHWFTAVSAVLVCGCACEPTPYQRAIPRSGMGYSERRISEDTFSIKYVAAACTPDAVLSKYLCHRAAEVTLQYGYRYFAVLGQPYHPTHMYTHTVGTLKVGRCREPEPAVVVESPTEGTLVMSIQCFKDAQESPEMAFIDAREYLARAVNETNPGFSRR